MELKTKYQYTYFIYPYLIEQKNYANYLYGLLKNKKCKLRMFNRKKDIELDSYFLPAIKNKLLWSLNVSADGIKSYESMDIKMKASVLSKEYCTFFEYNLSKDIPAKMGEENGIFFDINKVEIICFATGICFLLIKTVLNSSNNFYDVLNFNYKFREIHSQVGHSKEYDNIKIQTNKLNNMQNFSEFFKEIVGSNLLAKEANIDTEKLITYSYTCLEQNSWNENTDIVALEKEFEKYRNVLPASEQIDDIISKEESIYKEKYSYYGFSNNSMVLLCSASNIKNYTSLIFQYENQQLYHFIYNIHQKLYLKELNYEISKSKKFIKAQKKFFEFTKKDLFYEITNDPMGIILENYIKESQKIDETFTELKNKEDLICKKYEIEKINTQNKWLIAIMVIILMANIVNICNKICILFRK